MRVSAKALFLSCAHILSLRAAAILAHHEDEDEDEDEDEAPDALAEEDDDVGDGGTMSATSPTSPRCATGTRRNACAFSEEQPHDASYGHCVALGTRKPFEYIHFLLSLMPRFVLRSEAPVHGWSRASSEACA